MITKDSSLQRNIAANFVGQGSYFLIGLVSIPLYIRFLGIEAYGLIGFYATLQAVLNSVLDLGLSVTVRREIARYSASRDSMTQMRDLVRSIEVIYWIIGFVLGLMVCSAAPLIAGSWIRSENISIPIITNAIILMGLITFIQWPLTFYQGGLIGLQRMVLLNGINVVLAIVRGVGGILVLWLFSPTLIAFFLWQVAASALHVGITTHYLWRYLPASTHRPHFNPRLLRTIWHFAAGMTATSFFSFFLHYADRIILSRLLTLANFGAYSLAATLNDQLQLIGAQVHQALLPRFSALFAKNASVALRDLYHRASQVVSVITLPILGTASLFAFDLILLWTQDPAIARSVAPIASVLFLGTILVSLAGNPYSLTLASGWVSLGAYSSLVSVLLLIPLMITLTLRSGGIGAAAAWTLISLGNFALLPLIVHRRLLAGELKRWYVSDVGIPALATAAVLALAWWIVPHGLSMPQNALAMVLVILTGLACAAMAAREVRSSILARFTRCVRAA